MDDLPLARLAHDHRTVSCPEVAVTKVLMLMAEWALDEEEGGGVALPQSAVEDYWSDTRSFPPDMPLNPNRLFGWYEYDVDRALRPKTMAGQVQRHLRVQPPDVRTPERAGVGFVTLDGIGPHTWWTDGLVADMAANGAQPADASHSVLAITVVSFRPYRLAVALTAAISAFDASGEHLGNRWIVLSEDPVTRKLTDRQVAYQGLPAGLLLASPAWDAWSRA